MSCQIVAAFNDFASGVPESATALTTHRHEPPVGLTRHEHLAPEPVRQRSVSRACERASSGRRRSPEGSLSSNGVGLPN